MIEWTEKAGLWWDRAGNVERKTGGAYIRGGNDFVFIIQCVLVAWASAAIWEYGQDWRTWELQQQHEQEHSGRIEGDLTALRKTVSLVHGIAVWSEQKMYRWCEPCQDFVILTQSSELPNALLIISRRRVSRHRGSAESPRGWSWWIGSGCRSRY